MARASTTISRGPGNRRADVLETPRRSRLGIVAAVAVPLVLLGAVAVQGLDRPGGAASSQAGAQVSSAEGSGIAVGDRAPSFEVATLDGGQFAFPAGAPTILTFADLCPTCVEDTAKIAALQARFPGVKVLAVASDPTADDAALRSFIDQAGATGFEMALDPDSTLTQRFDAFSMGAAILVTDAEGRITYRGAVEEAQIETALQSAGARA